MTEATDTMTEEAEAKEEEATESEGFLESLYDEAVGIVEDLDFATVEGIQGRLNVDHSTAVWIIEKLQENGVVGNPEGNGYCKVLSRPDPSDEDSVDSERREKTMLAILEFGGELEKHAAGKDDIKFTVSIDRTKSNFEKIARMYGDCKGNPRVRVVGLEAELEQDADDALAQAKDDRQGELDLSGDDEGDGEGETEEGGE